MRSEQTTFGAAVVAAVGGVLGVGYLLAAMLALLSDGGDGVLVLSGSVPATTGVSMLLLLTAGLLGTGSGYGRAVGTAGFGAVAVLARPTLASPEPALAVQSGLALVVALSLVVRNPVRGSDRSNVDESTSATRVGSTLR